MHHKYKDIAFECGRHVGRNQLYNICFDDLDDFKILGYIGLYLENPNLAFSWSKLKMFKNLILSFCGAFSLAYFGFTASLLFQELCDPDILDNLPFFNTIS